MIAKKKLRVDDHLRIIERKFYEIRDEEKQFAKERFLDYQKKGILTGNWKDSQWKLDDSVKIIPLNFKISTKDYRKYYKENPEPLMDSMKYFIVLSMGNYAGTRLYITLLTIKKIVRETRYFTEPERLAEEGIVNWESMSQSAVEYFRMFPVPNGWLILEIMEDKFESSMGIWKQRELCEFQSYFLFDRLLDRFWDQADKEAKRHFYPLYLFYKFTTIYPERVTEFCVMPPNPVSKRDDGYTITVRKSNCKGHGKRKAVGYTLETDYDLYTFAVTEDMAALFIEYQKYRDAGGYETEEEYFFSRQMQTGRKGRYRMDDLCNLLDEMYTEFENLYGIAVYTKDEYSRKRNKPFLTDEDRLDRNEILRLHLGDTRHLSMIGLVANGISPLVVKQFAGHASLMTTDGYYSNIEKYISSSVYTAAATPEYAECVYNPDIYHNDKEIRLTGDAVSVDGGFCYSTNPADCFENIIGETINCKMCRYFKSDGTQMIKDLETDSKKKMRKQINQLAKLLTMKDREGKNEQIGIVLKQLRTEAEGTKKLILRRILEEQEK